MKNFIKISSMLLCFISSSCNLIDEHCELQVNVVDSSGTPVAGAFIEAYSSSSKEQGTVIIAYAQTDSLGHAKINYNPECLDYHKLIAYKGCSSNDYAGNIANTTKLIKANSDVTCQIEQTSTLVLKNKSDNQRSVFLNGQYLFDMYPDITKTITVLAKSNNIRIAESQISVSNPVSRSYDLTSTCGEIKILEFY
ncbi:MAG: Ig-like domain-containing protein [Saprospiraceae bacterium]|nr:Ig-like domain-containing protein [Saprospiraceae bacterium]HMW39385.1 Ig-like domain-containing protein [Saprospiraceae bacterium]HMX89212.1 Ig-like domain-containing protein [Saprospiraceae bacterium]HMZ41148.1 Ig-like domain-containing protein [Saprospiraceae bacterium]HNA64358.1 Ig-like domain-containing protein [Saprospiraceae bacterium]